MSEYPFNPGVRAHAIGGTSQAAAELVRPVAGGQCAVVLAELRSGPASPEEITARLHSRGERALLTSIRARVCQLRAQGRVVDSGLRGLGESGTAKVIKWRLATPEEHARAVAEREASR